MSWWDTVKSWVGLSESASLPAFELIDPDDHLFRKLTERGLSDLPSYQHDKMLAIATHLDRANPVARRILDLITQFMFAEGISVQASNTEVQAVIDEHWNDYRNRWDHNGPQLFRLLLRDGEVLLPAGINPANGFVRWGQLMSRSIEEVETDRDDWRLVRRVILKTKPGEPDDVRQGIVENEASGRLEPADDVPVEGNQKPVMLLRYGNPDGVRGLSFLYPLADFLEYIDRTAFSEVERMDLLRAFIWDVTVQDADDAKLRELARSPMFNSPKPATVKLHNESVEWAAETPNLDTRSSTDLLNWLLKTMVLGSTGIPEHWYGSGGDVNRAVGTVMNEPTIKMFSSMQRMWGGHLEQMFRFVIDQAVIHGRLQEQVELEDSDGKPTEEIVDPRDTLVINFPDLDTVDVQETSQALNNVVQSLLVAEDREWITKRTSRRVFASVVSAVGPDVDGDKEGEQIQKEQEQQDNEPAVPVETAEELDAAMAAD